MTKYIVGGVLTAIIAFAINVALYIGAFKSATVESAIKGPYKMIFKDHTGPYHKIVPAIEEVEKWVKANGQDCRFSFGEYIDDPHAVEQERLKSRGGCLVETFIDNMPEGFKTQEIPEQKFVRGFFTGSPAIGPYKVYDKAQEYMELNQFKPKRPVFEIYEVKTGKEMNTEYLFSIEQ